MQHERVKRLKSLGTLLDSKFKGPFGFRFGLDGILGLIPVFGDIATAAISFFIIIEAARLGVSGSVLLRMALNVALENIIGVIPVVGDLFDFIWKSNNKNISLLEASMTNPKATTLKSKIFLIFFILLLIAVTVATVVGSYSMLKYIFEWISNR